MTEMFSQIKNSSLEYINNTERFIIKGSTWSSWRIGIDVSNSLLSEAFYEILKTRIRDDKGEYSNDNSTRLPPCKHTLALLKAEKAINFKNDLGKLSYNVYSDSFEKREKAENNFREEIETKLDINLDNILRIHPINIDTENLSGHCLYNFKEYMALERYFMKNIEFVKPAKKFKLPIFSGISCMEFSNHNMLAVGTIHGSVYIYGIKFNDIVVYYFKLVII